MHVVSCRLQAKNSALRLNKAVYSIVKQGQEQGIVSSVFQMCL